MDSYLSLVKQLQLSRHPEGGYFRETYRSELMIPGQALPSSFGGNRNVCTSIYFLLPFGEVSKLHRIKSDELWHFHAGAPLSIYVFLGKKLTVLKLGADPSKGESFQLKVPANAWFGAVCELPGGFTLCGCTVAPGFDFKDFEMGDRNVLLEEFSSYRHEVEMLTAPA